MFWNNVKIAIRNLRKNKLFALINILGLALGMTVFVFGNLLVRYELTHDAFFANAERIWTVGSYAAPEINVGVDQINSVWSAVGPIIEAEVDEVEAVARAELSELLVTMGSESFYNMVRYADPALLRIFDLDFIGGDNTALDDPAGMIINESTAVKYFGTADAVGKVITFNNKFDFRVAGVFRDVPLNSHFNSLPIMDVPIEIVLPIKAWERIEDIKPEGNWDNLSMGNQTYVLLPANLDGEWLETQLAGLFERHVDEEHRQIMEAFFVEPLSRANLALWDTMGLPVITAVQLLSFLVLIVACVNYTNLATAQALGRSREVGMRKTMGAGQAQLLTQFLVESLVIAAIAMVVALAAVEVLSSAAQQPREQGAEHRLPAGAAVARTGNGAGRPVRRRVPGLAHHASLGDRRPARCGAQGQEGRDGARGHDRCTVRDLGVHAGHRRDRIHAEPQGGRGELHLSALGDLHPRTHERGRSPRPARHSAARTRGAAGCRRRRLFLAGAVRTEQFDRHGDRAAGR